MLFVLVCYVITDIYSYFDLYSNQYITFELVLCFISLYLQLLYYCFYFGWHEDVMLSSIILQIRSFNKNDCFDKQSLYFSCITTKHRKMFVGLFELIIFNFIQLFIYTIFLTNFTR